MSCVTCNLMRLAILTCVLSGQLALRADEQWVVYDGVEGPGSGKHIVLVSGDEEYRSEEALPQLGKILATQHGFKCTVLFAIDPDTGEIDPDNQKNIPGLEALESADLMIIATRFRDLPADQMQKIDDYLASGKPVIGMRTATHAFNNKGGPFAHYKNGYNGDKEGWKDGFGRAVLGEKWISHHGGHGRESTRGLIAKDQRMHPILRGIKDGDIWGPTDVYGVRLPLPESCQVLVLGEVVENMETDGGPAKARKNRKGEMVNPNDPMMPIAWTKTYQIENGSQGKAFTTTMGSADDLLSEGVRRMLVNSVFWAIGMDDEIKADNSVEIVGDYQPSPFKFGGYRKGTRPADYALD